MSEQANLEAAIRALEAQRAILGDAVVDAAQASLREKLAQLAAKEQQAQPQLKYLTVLFADIVGSTRMGSDLDPEDILNILDNVLQKFAGVITRHGGKVLRFMGDGLMAAFGVPVAHEDDVRRAVQAGLDLLREGRLHAEEVKARWGVGSFQVRVGINTGYVVVGGGVEAENTVMGSAINIAARMETAALPDSVLISHETYQHVRNLFTFQAQPPLMVKGKDEPMRTYLVLSAAHNPKPRAAGGVGGAKGALVGRQAELASLQATWQRLQEHSKAQVVVVAGDLGVGKSRLVTEFSRWVEVQAPGIVQIRGAANEHTAQVPYSLLRAAFIDYLDIRDGDHIALVCQKLEAGLSAYLDDEAQMKAYFIGAMLGFDIDSSHLSGAMKADPQQLRSRALFYLSRYMAALAQRHPILLVLDDFQWADTPSREALLRIVNENPDARLMLVYLTRLRYFQEHPEWEDQAGERAGYNRINLEPLSSAASLELVKAILSEAEQIPGGVCEQVAAAAEGNPFYLEEVLSMLVDDGVLYRQGDGTGWRVSSSQLQNLRVPPTLTSVLQARLESLAVPERATLQQASVIGRTFWDSLLQALQKDDQTPVPQLSILEQRAMIYSLENSSFENAREYCFKHGFLQNMIYESILKSRRQGYHGAAAEWLVAAIQKNGRGDEYAAQIARHYALAGEPSTAAEWYIRAGRRAIGQAGYAEARHFFDQALDRLTENLVEQRWQALLGRSEALGVLGETEARMADDAALVALAQATSDDSRLAEACYRRGFFIGSLGDQRLAMENYDTALAAARRTGGLPDWEAVLRSLKVVSYVRQGALDLAALEVTDVLACLDKVGGEDNINLAMALNNISIYFNAVGDYAQAARLMHTAAGISRCAGDRVGETTCQLNSGYFYVMVGLFAQGQAELETALRGAENIGFKASVAFALLNLGLAYTRQGEQQSAKRALEQALNGIEATNRAAWAYGQCYLGLNDESNGDALHALEHFSSASRAFDELGYPGSQQEARAGTARAHLQLGKPAEAYQIARSLWEYLGTEGAQGLEFPGLAFLTCAQVFRTLGDDKTSAAAVQAGYTYLVERANRLSDPEWRQSFLENIPENRTLAQLQQAADKSTVNV
jgi:predicted ATPase/class 3 adenylate cyclase